MSTCLACGGHLTPITGIRVHPACATDPDRLVTEAFQLFERTIIGQPRSLQTRIGPSELGVPCDRRIGYHLAGIRKVNDRGVAWKPYVGTALHEQFAGILAAHEIERFANDPDATTRHHVEERVSVGEVNGVEITGSCDWFDEQHGAVWDFKFTTRAQIRDNYKPKGPGQQYRTQGHLYGRGWQRAGMDVRTVGVIWFTRDGEFTDRHVWWEPYDEQIAIDALDRATSIAATLDALGPGFTIPALPTADSHCSFCPWHQRNSANLGTGCPGHPVDAFAMPTLAETLR